MEKRKFKREEALMQAIGFTEEDLEANREGQLSQRQRDEIKRLRMTWYGIKIICVVISPIVLILLILPLFDSRTNKSGLFIFIAMAVTVLGYSAYYAMERWNQYRKDLAENRTAVIEGRVKIKVFHYKEPKYKISIEDVRFEVSKEIFLTFKNGDPYIIYYAPYSNKLLSAEWLRE